MRLKVTQFEIDGTPEELAGHVAAAIALLAPPRVVEAIPQRLAIDAPAAPVAVLPVVPAQKKTASPKGTPGLPSPGTEAVFNMLNDLEQPMSFSEMADKYVVPTGSLHMHLQKLLAASRIDKLPNKTYVVTRSSSSTGTTSERQSGPLSEV
jgi:hypothetical protein